MIATQTTIRSATPTDATAIATLFGKMFERILPLMNLSVDGMRLDHWRNTQLCQHLLSGAPSFVAVDEAGRIVAAIVTRRMFPALLPIRILWVEGVFVEEEFRRGGIAKQLFETVFAFAKDNNFGRVMGEIACGNDEAKLLCDGLGMKAVSTNIRKEIE